MENKLENYRAYIQQLLEEYANLGTPDPDVDRQTIFDTDRDHYQLVYAGWKNRDRRYGCLFHLDIKDGKIWIQLKQNIRARNRLSYQLFKMCDSTKSIGS